MALQPETFNISGSFHSHALHESGDAPENIIEQDSPYHIHVHMQLHGGGTPVLANDRVVLEARLESMGGGFEGTVGSSTVTLPDPMPSNYDLQIAIPCGSPQSDGLQDGVYKMVVLATVQTAGGNPLGIVGFDEGPMIQVYTKP